MKALSLFSGIGGIDLACEWARIETVAFCEREPFPQKVLRKHWPNVPIYDDVCTLTKERLEADGIGTIDLIHGGYPCQPFSNAGNRKGTEDDRHLWPEYFRLVKELRPRWVVGENVAGHITLGLDIVLSDLESEGYSTRTFVIPAVSVNARHRRERVFIVGYAKCGGRSRKSWGWAKQESSDRYSQLEKRIAANAASQGLPIGRQSERTESEKKNGTRVESEPERCGEDVSHTNGTGRKEQHASPFSDRSRQRTWGTPSGWEQWAVEPAVGRVANGIPQRVDRLKGLGNAVVPQQIYPIMVAIKQIDDMMRTV